MKPGFKPTKFTRKEWRGARSSACSGSGVGKALDQWQKLFDPKLSQMGLKKCSAALNMADKLDKALEVAKKKCNAKKHKETIAGISEYSKIVNHYKAALLRAIFKTNNRDKYIKSLNDVKDLEKDSALWQLYGKFSKTGGAMFYPQFDTYNLIKKNNIAQAIKKYGKKGKQDNDYNFYASHKKRCLNNYRNCPGCF